MKRPHRSIETFDISLMAVVTKAMGAFLVLMLLLMPYYSSSPLGKDEAQDLAKKVQDADAKIKGVLGKLGDKELGKDLAAASEQLGSGQQLINQLKRYVDQLASQVARLEERIKTLTADLERLKSDNQRLDARVAQLEPENARLKDENEKLKAELEKLKQQLAELKKQIAELEKSPPEQVAELKKRLKALEEEIERLMHENADLKSQVASLENDLANLRARVAQLEQANAALQAQVAPLQQENAELRAKLEELKRYGVISGNATSLNCKQPFSLGILTQSTRHQSGDSHVLGYINTLGSLFSSPWRDGYSTGFIYNRAKFDRYFVFLIFRVGVGEPLQVAKQACSVFTTIVADLNGHSNQMRAMASFKPGDRYLYLFDIAATGSSSVASEDASSEGRAYLEDQFAHATWAPTGPTAPLAPAPSAQGDGGSGTQP